MTNDIEALSALRQAQTNLTPAELLALPMEAYGRLTGRSLRFEPQPEPMRGTYAEDIPEPRFSETVTSPEPQGIDVSQLTVEQYAAVRAQLGVGVSRQEGVGLFNQSGQSWAEAAQRQPGRSGWQARNQVDAPQLVGRQERQGDRLDYRSAADRLSTPGNSFQG
jgi:hypothetical protein